MDRVCTLGTFIVIRLFEFKYTSVSIILTSPAHQYMIYKHKHKSSILHVTETHSVSVGISVCPSGDRDSGECALGVKCVDLGLIAGTAPLDFLDPRVNFVSGCKVVVFIFRFLCTLVASSPVNDNLGQTFEGCSCSIFLHLL